MALTNILFLALTPILVPTERLVWALARGLRHEDAAREAGLSLRTVSRRLNDPLVRQRIQEVREAVVGEVRSGVLGGALEAVAVLRGLLQAQSEAVRLAAARSLLEGFVRFQKVESLAERIARLEAREGMALRCTDEKLDEILEWDLIRRLRGRGGRFAEMAEELTRSSHEGREQPL